MQKKYTKEQEEIITSTEKNILVIAGAGSGKTFTMIERILYLINNKNVNPENILCISFTNEAVKSIQRKLKEQGVFLPHVYTFHKFGLYILKEAKKTFKIADSTLLDEFIKESLFYALETKEGNQLFKKILKKKKKEKFTNQEINELQKNSKTSIALIEANQRTKKEIVKNIAKQKKKIQKDLLLFLEIVWQIKENYEREKNSSLEIDFEDMIALATEEIKNSTNKFFFTHIFVDEFQDTSKKRLDLILSMKEKCQANLFVVGDDFQSIYRFSGCDIHLFLHLEKFVSPLKIYKLQETFRCDNTLVKVAGDFIMQNPLQIKKEMTAKKESKKPIKFLFYKKEKPLEKALDYLKKEKKNILILGRNNSDLENSLENKNFSLPLNTRFLTVHKAKGLEEEIVLLLPLKNSINGFPNQIQENLFLTILKEKEEYPYAEERRLFYVALTRTKGPIYLLVPKKKKERSIFALELQKKYKNHIEFLQLP